MMKFLVRLFSKKSKINKVDTLNNKIKREKKKDLKDLKKINRRVKLMLKQGNIEIFVNNVEGVVKEIK